MLQGEFIMEPESALPAKISSTPIVPMPSLSAVVEATHATSHLLLEDAQPAEWPDVVPVEWRALLREWPGITERLQPVQRHLLLQLLQRH